jgi:hypothetical protein
MIYWGTGSYIGKVFVPVPDPVPAPLPDPDLFSTVFPQQKIVQDLAFFALCSIVSQKVGL